jgi:hypothetical protein
MPKNNLDKQLTKLRRNKRLLWVGILFFAAVVLWIGVSLFSAQKKISISQELRDLASPLIPRLEATVFTEISEQRYLPDEELSEFPIYIFNDEAQVTTINQGEEVPEATAEADLLDDNT